MISAPNPTFANSPTRYGLVARALHWLTALLILSAIGLALYTETLPRDTEAGRATLMQIFALHKTIGVAAFFTALIRILWALTQTQPVELHPERRAENFAAHAVHWLLYGAMLLMPLSGWIAHSASSGFAQILWPLPQALPFIPQSDSIAKAASGLHELAALVLYAAIALHIAGAVKHVLIDKDGTLGRMTTGRPAGPAILPPAHSERHLAAPLLAAATFAALIAATLVFPEEDHSRPTAAQTTAPQTTTATTTTAGNWTMTQGTLALSITQMGATVAGSFQSFTPTITFDETTQTGDVTVQIPLASLTLGTVTDQAMSADFFDAATFPEATFTAQIALSTAPSTAPLTATGTLTLKGITKPLTLPFALTITGNEAKMTGATTLNRLDFNVGESYADEATVAHGVTLTVDLTAQRN